MWPNYGWGSNRSVHSNHILFASQNVKIKSYCFVWKLECEVLRSRNVCFYHSFSARFQAYCNVTKWYVCVVCSSSRLHSITGIFKTKWMFCSTQFSIHLSPIIGLFIFVWYDFHSVENMRSVHTNDRSLFTAFVQCWFHSERASRRKKW